MSVKVMGLVFDIRGLSPTLKFVLLAYADHASHDGSGVWPAVQSIADKTGYSKRTIQNATKELEELGYMEKIGQHRSGTNLWQITIPYMGGAGDSPPGAQEIRPPRAGDAPEPLINHHLEPLEEGEGPNIFLLYEESIGPLTGKIGDELKSLEDDYPAMWIEDAFTIAKEKNAKSLKYVIAILDRWNKTGKDNGYKKGGKKKELDLSAFDRLEKELYGENS